MTNSDVDLKHAINGKIRRLEGNGGSRDTSASESVLLDADVTNSEFV